MNKIVLAEEKETSLIPLFGKAKENQKDKPLLIDKKAFEIKLIKEEYFTSNEEIKNLSSGISIMFKIADLFTIAKKAHRLLIYRVGDRSDSIKFPSIK